MYQRTCGQESQENGGFEGEEKQPPGELESREALVAELIRAKDELGHMETSGDPNHPGWEEKGRLGQEINNLERRLNAFDQEKRPEVGASGLLLVGDRIRFQIDAKPDGKYYPGILVHHEPGIWVIDPDGDNLPAILRLPDTNKIEKTKAAKVKEGDRVSFEERRNGWQTREGIVTDLDGTRFQIKSDDGNTYSGDAQRSKSVHKVYVAPQAAEARKPNGILAEIAAGREGAQQ